MTNLRMFRLSLFLLLAVATISTIAMVFVPRQWALADLRSQLHSREQYIQQSQHLDALITNMETEFEAAQAYVDARIGSGASDAQLLAVFGRIADEAKKSGVATQRFQPEPVEHEQSPVRRLTATVVTEGDFCQIFDFLARLEQLPFTLWLDDLNLKLADEETDQVNCQVKLVIFADNRGNSD